MKNILMVVLNDIDRDARVKREALALKLNNYKINIIGLNDKIKKNIFYIQGIKVNQINLITKKVFGKNIIGWLARYIEFCSKLFFMVIFNKIDFIHAHNLDALLPCYFIAKIKRAKLIYDSHELFTEMSGNRNQRINKFWKIVERILIKRVDQIISANESRAKIMHEEYGAKMLPTSIMNIPLKRSMNKSDFDLDIRKTYFTDLPKNFSMILYQGVISEQRNITVLVKSVTKWKKESILVLIGPCYSETLKHKITMIINENNLQNRVIHIDEVKSEELLHYTLQADIGVVIYKNNSRNNYYCAPNKLFEYSACKIPMVGCDFPEVKKVINKYKIGELFDPENEQELALAINKILDNYNYYSNKENFSKLFNNINWEIQVEKLVNLYSKLERDS